MQSLLANQHAGASATPPAIDLIPLMEITRRKDAVLKKSVRNFAILNIAAALGLLSLMQLSLQQGTLAEFQPYAASAFAAFLSGSMIPAIVYGMRLSGVILELIGSSSALKFNVPVVASLAFGIGSFLTGSAFAYHGLAMLPTPLF